MRKDVIKTFNDSMNYYIYTSNNPVIYFDPLGLKYRDRYTDYGWSELQKSAKEHKKKVEEYKRQLKKRIKENEKTTYIKMGEMMRDSMVGDMPPGMDCLNKEVYCTKITYAISIASDVASITSTIVIAGSAGVATPVAGPVRIGASIVGAANGFITIMVCDSSTGWLSIAAGGLPSWGGAMMSLIDAEINAYEYLNQ